MPQQTPKTQNGAKKTLPRAQANTKTLQPSTSKATPQLRREEAFYHEEASDTESDSESDVEEEVGHDAQFDKHLGSHPQRQQHVHDGPRSTYSGGSIHNSMDSNGKTRFTQLGVGPSNRLGHTNVNQLLHERFERDHNPRVDDGSTMDVETDLLHNQGRRPDIPHRK